MATLRKLNYAVGAIFLLAGLVFSLIQNDPALADTDSVSVPSQPVAESVDYATRVLGEPWDMDGFGDVSIYFNESGQRLAVDSFSFQNGVFNGHSEGNDPQNGWFHVLFPGYEGTVHSGKVGSRFPVSSSTYGCMYIAMRVETARADDRFRVLWFANDRLNSELYGQSNWLVPYPEAASNPSSAWKWKLYRINLPQESITSSPYTPWSGQASWQGLRIDPTRFGNVNYAVDWVRLTNCQTQNVTITFTPSNSIQAIWVRPEGSNRYIRLADNVNGSSGRYTLDTQGLQAGNYTVGFGGSGNCCVTESTGLLRVQASPRLTFERPSFWSGEDYASLYGNPWDFSSSSDVKQILNAAGASYQNGALNLTTNSGPLPAGTDVQLILNNPAPANSADFRYLTFRMNTSWKAAWQNVTDGMIVRWVWSVQGSSGRSGYRCNLVSQDIPFDTDWDTITVDLHDGFGGSAEQVQGECSGYPHQWLTSRPVLDFRFDPNENVTVATDPITGGGPFYQQIDWIRLTRPDSIQRGGVYPIQLSMDTAMDDLTTLALYYTTNRSNPTAHLIYQQQMRQPESAAAASGEAVLLPADNLPLFLPVVTTRPTISFNGPQVEYFWDTSGVPAGAYYICSVLTNATGQSTICSEASVTIQ
jgi:hypothetical protein